MDNDEQDYMINASRLHMEAKQLLDSTGLLSLLAGYGEVYPTGSYAYDLMTWRDIDLCVAIRDLSIPTVFHLGVALAGLPNVGAMYYRNEFIMKTEGNPCAIFWCLDFYFPNEVKWKVDVLLAAPDEVERVLLPALQLQKKLTPEIRKTILRIKGVISQRSVYRRDYNSRAVYRAVTEDNVKTVEEWDVWWARQQR